MNHLSNHKDIFENRLKDQVEDFKMMPGTDSWKQIQNAINEHNRRSAFLSITLLFICLFLFSHRIDNSFNFKLSDSILNNAKRDSYNKLHFNNTRIEHSKTANLASAENVFIKQHPSKNSVFHYTENELSTAQPDVVNIEKANIHPHGLEFSIQSPFHRVQPFLQTPPIHFNTNIAGSHSNQLPASKMKHINKLQFFVTPSISHRIPTHVQQAASSNEEMNQIRQIPSAGFEAGAAILIPLTNRFSFRTGIQFNYTHYNSRINRDFSSSGSTNQYLKNTPTQSFQVSVPAGFEYRVGNSSRLNWFVATHIQATYMLKTTGNLYVPPVQKSAIVQDLLSRMNGHAAFETFIRWGHKKTTLQIGPQLRCQLRSNTNPKISSKEHLIDYGIKIGIVQSLR